MLVVGSQAQDRHLRQVRFRIVITAAQNDAKRHGDQQQRLRARAGAGLFLDNHFLFLDDNDRATGESCRSHD